ncbi:MAG: FKBP-type peptidyl-prolyl cis-trans isomerase [Pseudomonadota bacterium]|nr:FKBP-type peptidyl-prolyl cis-trans isomerase [Pseudomonadota bacterium]
MRAPSPLLALICALALGACARSPVPAVDASNAGKAFLARNAAAPGVHVTKSGLQYRILRSGPPDGLRPKPADEVKVNYEGKLLDGEVFDSSYARGKPVAMTVRDLVPGWIEALQLMRPGDEWLLYVPPSLGYGEKGAGPIPPGAVLVFKLELLDVLPDASSVGRA